MIRATELLASIDRHIVATQEKAHRVHLGASLIGDECSRKIWYSFHWTKAEAFDARMLRLFNRGHLEEARFNAYLRGIGVQVWDAGENGAMKAAMRISDCKGHFGGTPDGIAKGVPGLPPDEPCLLEYKTHNKKSFDKLTAEGLHMSKWKHFVQMQTYMFKLQLEWGLYMAVNKEDDAITAEFVRNDHREGARSVERANGIIWANEPPARVAKLPTNMACKFCHLSRLCWFGDVKPDVNCRTCTFGFPIPGGLWTCAAPGAERTLNEDAQRAACPRYNAKAVFSKV